MIDMSFEGDVNWIWVSSKCNLDILVFVDYLGDFNELMGLLLEDDLDCVDLFEFFLG